MSLIRILIADDHPSIREGLRLILESDRDFQVVAEAGNGHEAVEQFMRYRPDLVLMDLQMPALDGLEATQLIRRAQPDARVVILTSYPGDARVSRAFAAGATSYLLKTVLRAGLLAALRATLAGRSVLDNAVLGQSQPRCPRDSLSAREIAVLKLVSSGHQNTQIARRLNVSVHAIKARVKQILSKLNARDRTHAVTIARHRGFIDC